MSLAQVWCVVCDFPNCKTVSVTNADNPIQAAFAAVEVGWEQRLSRNKGYKHYCPQHRIERIKADGPH